MCLAWLRTASVVRYGQPKLVGEGLGEGCASTAGWLAVRGACTAVVHTCVGGRRVEGGGWELAPG